MSKKAWPRVSLKLKALSAPKLYSDVFSETMPLISLNLAQSGKLAPWLRSFVRSDPKQDSSVTVSLFGVSRTLVMLDKDLYLVTHTTNVTADGSGFTYNVIILEIIYCNLLLSKSS